MAFSSLHDVGHSTIDGPRSRVERTDTGSDINIVVEAPSEPPVQEEHHEWRTGYRALLAEWQKSQSGDDGGTGGRDELQEFDVGTSTLGISVPLPVRPQVAAPRIVPHRRDHGNRPFDIELPPGFVPLVWIPNDDSTANGANTPSSDTGGTLAPTTAFYTSHDITDSPESSPDGLHLDLANSHHNGVDVPIIQDTAETAAPTGLSRQVPSRSTSFAFSVAAPSVSGNNLTTNDDPYSQAELELPSRPEPYWQWSRRMSTVGSRIPSPPRYPSPAPKVDLPEVDFPIHKPLAKPQVGSMSSLSGQKPSDIKDDAELWKTYMLEGQEWDKSTMEDWNANMDVILIFAGLFSAILTAFIIEFYRNLQPDPQDTTAQALLDIRQLLQGHSIQNSTGSVSSSDFKISLISAWVNGLWFAGLTLSLGTAMTVMLVKQWLQFYLSDLNKKNVYSYAQYRQYRHNALLLWCIPEIVSALPLAMHLSVWLFLAGLVIQLWEVNSTIASVMLVIILLLVASYMTTLVLPLIYASCPYRTFGSLALEQGLHKMQILFCQTLYIWFSLADAFKYNAWAPLKLAASIGNRIKKSSRFWWPAQLKKLKKFMRSPRKIIKGHLRHIKKQTHNRLEGNEIKLQRAKLELDALLWLLEVSQEPTAVDLALISVSKLKPEENMVTRVMENNVFHLLLQKAYVPLINHNVDLMAQKVLRIMPEHCVQDTTKLQSSGKYLQSLMTIWHHSDYFLESKPPVIPEEDRWNDQVIDFYKVDAIMIHPQEQPLRLFGEWLHIWRLLRHEHKEKINVMSKIWNTNYFALLVCTEAHYFILSSHHQQALVDNEELEPSYNAFSWKDLNLLLKDNLDGLLLEPSTIETILDTIIYGITNTTALQINNALLTPEMLLLLLKFIDKNKATYQDNNILEKAIFCLDAFCDCIFKRDKSEKIEAYWKDGGKVSFSQEEGLHNLISNVDALIHAYLANRSIFSQEEFYDENAKMSARILLGTLMKLHDPSTSYHATLKKLPPCLSKDIIEVIDIQTLHLWSSEKSLVWLIRLLSEWSDHNMSVGGRLRAFTILGVLLHHSWPTNTHTRVCKAIIRFMTHVLDRKTSHADKCIVVQILGSALIAVIKGIIRKDMRVCTKKCKDIWTYAITLWDLNLHQHRYYHEKEMFNKLNRLVWTDKK